MNEPKPEKLYEGRRERGSVTVTVNGEPKTVPTRAPKHGADTPDRAVHAA